MTLERADGLTTTSLALERMRSRRRGTTGMVDFRSTMAGNPGDVPSTFRLQKKGPPFPAALSPTLRPKPI
jgi:hypothetical protein